MYLIQSCSFKNEVDSNYYCQKFKLRCTQSNKIVHFKTTKGDFEVKLFGKDNPVTVSNFLENIENNIYVNQKFYKIIKYPQISFIHGGINQKNKFDIERKQTLKKTSLSIPLEIKFKDEIKPRYLPLQRFERVELLDEASREPKSFDMEEFIHKNNLGFTFSKDLYTFEAIFDKTMAYHLLETPLNDTQTVKEFDNNRLRIKARIPDTLQFEQWLMSFGSDVEILKPKKLRDKFKKISRKLNQIYKD